MARRKNEEEQAPGSPAWMATFSDLMNLLLCFFILLFASSTIDAEKLQEISASFSKDNIFQAGSTAVGEGRMVSSGVKQLSVLENFVHSLGRNQEGKDNKLSDVKDESVKPVEANSSTEQNQSTQQNQSQSTQQSEAQQGAAQQNSDTQQASQTTQSLEQQLSQQGYNQSEQMSEEIEQMLESSKISNQVSLSYNAQFVELSLNGGLLFDSGKAEITREAEALVNKVGNILQKYKNRTIEIEGHTDNVPVGGEYKDNQYLSAARAISVYEYLLEHKNLIPANMKHSGYGDSKPRASNNTPEGRAKNRRVEIKIYNKLSSQNEQ
ncbi:MAG: flagellar motor protein MotB [Lachnospira sp.]|nr:flagellar motor protein MotB [Lachnospira sp.]